MLQNMSEKENTNKIGSVFDIEQEKEIVEVIERVNYKKIEELILKTLDKRALAMFNKTNKFIGYGQFIELSKIKESAKQ
jgi:hypothetical protein